MSFERITVNPAQMGGQPCIRGLRIPVATVVDMVADGMKGNAGQALPPGPSDHPGIGGSCHLGLVPGSPAGGADVVDGRSALGGTPSKNLQAGSSSLTVQVTETVTTLNGTKKVKTKTTVQTTIPLTIT